MATFKYTPCYMIPTLDEIIKDDCLRDCGPYNRSSFVQFLQTSHCMENLEFFIEVDRLLHCMLLNDNRNGPAENLPRSTTDVAAKWLLLYQTFLAKDSTKEVNLSHNVALKFCPDQLPSQANFVAIRKMAYELLMDTYDDFVSHIRDTTNDRTTRRRCLDLLAGETSWPDLSQLVPRLAVVHTRDCSDLALKWEEALQGYEEAHNNNSMWSNCGNTTFGNRRGSPALLVPTCGARCSYTLCTIVHSIKGYAGWNKTKKRLRIRRPSHEKPEPLAHGSL
ncbi:hypothetical protein METBISCDRAFT_21274 [Metschnikowia bicuspidata]|uniref:RGS domain-containing protein n=1 Tax=Metschnikowia bicuspidata TaxID=27322 RepID=A0A4P9ZHT8_9ASCO|nr:hypothetical protein METBISCDRAFT_21274 [Metschnikowia bicuspidata]